VREREREREGERGREREVERQIQRERERERVKVLLERKKNVLEKEGERPKIPAPTRIFVCIHIVT